MKAFFPRPLGPCVALLLLGLGAHARAATVTVTSTADTGAGTLRQVVQDATPGDTIEFALADPAVIFVLTPVSIDKNLTITGPGADQLALDGGGFDTVLRISAGATVDVRQLTVRNGGASGIHNSGTLTMSRVVFSANYSNTLGGAIANLGTLTANDSTFAQNRAGNRAGAIYNNAGATVNRCSFTGNTAVHDGGAIANFGTIEVNKSTFSGNTSVGDFGGSGGAIFNNATVVLKDSTLTGNATSGAGGAIFTRGTLTISGSTIGSNSVAAGGSGSAIFNYINVSVSRSIVVGTCAGAALVSAGDNIGSTDSCVVDWTELNDRANLNARLGALTDNGGPTSTQILQAGSPAIDEVRVDTAACTGTGTDQRGVRRPSGARCDIGAVEMDFDTLFTNGFE